MGALAELIIAVTDLVEAEAMALRRGFVATAFAVASTCSAVLLALAGTALGLWGLYLVLLSSLTPPLAAFATSAASLITAGSIVLGVRRLT